MSARILIIEDDRDILESVSRLLVASGYTLIAARDGLEGLEKARVEHPDLILTDLMLPKLNGYELCTMLKQDTRYQRIPILIWSATKMQEKDAQVAKDCGADAYLLKTLAPSEVVKKIQETLVTSH